VGGGVPADGGSWGAPPVGGGPPANAGGVPAAGGAGGAGTGGSDGGEEEPRAITPCADYSRQELLTAAAVLMHRPRGGGVGVCSGCSWPAARHRDERAAAATGGAATIAAPSEKDRRKDLTFDSRRLFDAAPRTVEAVNILRAVKAADCGSTDHIGDPNIRGLPLTEAPRRELLISFWEREEAWAASLGWIARSWLQMAVLSTRADGADAPIAWAVASANAKAGAEAITGTALFDLGLLVHDTALGLGAVARVDERTFPTAAAASKLRVPYAGLGPVTWINYLRNTDVDAMRRWFTRLATDGPRADLFGSLQDAYSTSPLAMWALVGHAVSAAGHAELEAPLLFWQRFHGEDARRRLALRDLFPDRTTAADAEMEVEALQRRLVGSGIGKRTTRPSWTTAIDPDDTDSDGIASTSATAGPKRRKKKARIAPGTPSPKAAATKTPPGGNGGAKKAASAKAPADRTRDDCYALHACFKCKEPGHRTNACTGTLVGAVIP
jgi:hypothetical protein